MELLGRSALGDGALRTADAPSIENLLLLFGWTRSEQDVSVARAELKSLIGRNPSVGQAGLDPAEIVDLLIAEGLNGQGSFWRDRCVTTGRQLVADLCGTDAAVAPDLRNLPPRQFRIAFERTFNLARTAAGSRLRLRMPLPVVDEALTDLVVETDADIGKDRLETKLVSPGEGLFTTSARLSFVARPRSRDASSPASMLPWLAEWEGPIEVTPVVRALADRLAPPSQDPRAQIDAFRDHLLDTMACGIVNPARFGGEAGIDWVIGNGWFDCRLGAALLVALCRAHEIPARLIGGYLLWDAPTEHYWMEAWLPGEGWTPYDMLAWDLSAGGRDPAWRGVYAGALDYRMKTQVFPDLFTGAPGVPMGGAWHRLSRLIPGGVETRFVSVPDGELIYADAVRILTA